MINFIKNNIKDIGLIVGVVFLLLYFFSPQEKIIEVPFRVEIPVPIVEVEFDTVYLPSKIIREPSKKEIDSTYYDKYISLKDSIKKDSLFKEAIQINEYNTKFEDDTLTINIYSKTRGELLAIKSNYKTKPRKVLLDTVLSVAIPKYNEFYIGVEGGLPIINIPNINSNPILKGNLFFKTKKDNIWSVSVDTEGRLFAGLAFKLGN